jgi:hypothetical protein
MKDPKTIDVRGIEKPPDRVKKVSEELDKIEKGE